MSRSSSVSTKDKASQGKRTKGVKQRRDDSENFDVRSQYTPFFPQQQQQSPSWIPSPQYGPMALQPFNGMTQTNFQNPIAPQFVPPPQFNPTMMNNGNAQPYNNVAQVKLYPLRLAANSLTKTKAVSSTWSTAFSTEHASCLICPSCTISIPSSTAMAAAERVPGPISGPRAHGPSPSCNYSICFRSVTQHRQPRRP